MASLIPEQVEWIQKEALEFVPEKNELRLREEEGKSSPLRYKRLVVAPGLELDWGAIEGLEPTLGRNGVTSNYDFSSCQYTAELVEQLSATAGGRRPRAIFTQPPMPIKCAGAPQKALYLSAHAWESAGAAVDLTFCSAGPALFGVKEFVPTLQGYMDR